MHIHDLKSNELQYEKTFTPKQYQPILEKLQSQLFLSLSQATRLGLSGFLIRESRMSRYCHPERWAGEEGIG